MRVCFYIIGFLIFYSCSENKASSTNTGKSPNVLSADTIINDDMPPVYEYLFDPTLADGFIYPVKWETKSADRNLRFLKKITTDTSSNVKGSSENFIFNPSAREKVEIVMPANGIIIGINSEPNGFKTINTFHVFIENGEKKAIGFQIRGLDSTIKDFGQVIPKNTFLGFAGGMKQDENSIIKISILHSGKAIPFYLESPSRFVKEYSVCMIPSQVEKLIFAHKSDYKMYFFEKGELKKEYTIALSQDPIGHKQKQGDNKLPEGMYRISEKKLGPFGGDVGPWLGVAWMQFSYPNKFDAINGYKKGAITLAEKNAIVTADKNNQPTNSYTDLGGRVGIHGWDGDWIPNGTQNLTWGCISMFNSDIKVLYDLVPLNTPIIIVP